MQLEFRDARMQDLWQTSNPGKPMPKEVAEVRSYECIHDSQTIGHCAGNCATGEILGLMVVPAHQGHGIAARLLSMVVDRLRTEGARRIWLASPPDPALRAYGFYRAQGWVPTGEKTSDGSEILELVT